MRKLFLCLGLVAAAISVAAQTYAFEADYNQWTAQQGTLSRVDKQRKEGQYSLQW